MAAGLRKTGISVLGDVSWGTHLCHFYETKEDLLDILIPYFKTGLENNEYCVWVVSDPLSDEEARNALRQAIPDADRYLAAGHIEIVPHTVFPPASQKTFAAGRIEIVPHTEWYLKGGAFVAEQVIEGWNQKLAEALARGYAGLRANGNESWLTEQNRKDFFQYEKTLDEKLADQRMIVLCSYPLSSSSAAQIFDVVNIHQLAVIRRHGNWEALETPELKRSKQEVQRLNQDLEQRVSERTTELAAANEDLKTEIAERKRAEEALRRNEDNLRLVIDTIPIMAWSVCPDGAVDFVNQRWLDYTGLSLEEEVEEPTRAIHPEDLPRVIEKWLADMTAGEPSEDEIRLRRADGEYRWFMVLTEPLRDEQGNIVKWYGVSIDIEDRKRAENRLKATTEQLRALSARLQMAKEEESTRIARELHDELGSALTSLKWNLELLEKDLLRPADDEGYSRMRGQIKDMAALIDNTVNSVRRISAELRPSVLDDLGLVAALQSYLHQFPERTGIVTRVDSSVDDLELTPQQSTALFRIFQEALTNVLRHAQATKVDIRISRQNGQFVLTISDNGRGISESEKSSVLSLGLLGMQERARLVGGEIDITTRQEGGTVITVRVPIARDGDLSSGVTKEHLL